MKKIILLMLSVYIVVSSNMTTIEASIINNNVKTLSLILNNDNVNNEKITIKNIPIHILHQADYFDAHSKFSCDEFLDMTQSPINSNTMHIVIHYMYESAAPYTGTYWDIIQRMINDIHINYESDIKILFNLILAANYLQFKPLYIAVCHILAKNLNIWAEINEQGEIIGANHLSEHIIFDIVTMHNLITGNIHSMKDLINFYDLPHLHNTDTSITLEHYIKLLILQERSYVLPQQIFDALLQVNNVLQAQTVVKVIWQCAQIICNHTSDIEIIKIFKQIPESIFKCAMRFCYAKKNQINIDDQPFLELTKSYCLFFHDMVKDHIKQCFIQHLEYLLPLLLCMHTISSNIPSTIVFLDFRGLGNINIPQSIQVLTELKEMKQD